MFEVSMSPGMSPMSLALQVVRSLTNPSTSSRTNHLLDISMSSILRPFTRKSDPLVITWASGGR